MHWTLLGFAILCPERGYRSASYLELEAIKGKETKHRHPTQIRAEDRDPMLDTHENISLHSRWKIASPEMQHCCPSRGASSHATPHVWRSCHPYCGSQGGTCEKEGSSGATPSAHKPPARRHGARDRWSGSAAPHAGCSDGCCELLPGAPLSNTSNARSLGVQLVDLIVVDRGLDGVLRPLGARDHDLCEGLDVDPGRRHQAAATTVEARHERVPAALGPRRAGGLRGVPAEEDARAIDVDASDRLLEDRSLRAPLGAQVEHEALGVLWQISIGTTSAHEREGSNLALLRKGGSCDHIGEIHLLDKLGTIHLEIGAQGTEHSVVALEFPGERLQIVQISKHFRGNLLTANNLREIIRRLAHDDADACPCVAARKGFDEGMPDGAGRPNDHSPHCKTETNLQTRRNVFEPAS
mmetsp:Transcript_22131/g.57734  ORF Transcript_22131/g.57734 Transcript_22131/m.57734 type:complete len:411 (+) Transcript_22131:70-1302(+)